VRRRRDRDRLVEELRDRINSLERRIDEERESRRRADTIIAQLTQANVALNERLRELEAPSESPEGPQSAAEGRGSGETRPGGEEAQEGAQRSEPRGLMRTALVGAWVTSFGAILAIFVISGWLIFDVFESVDIPGAVGGAIFAFNVFVISGFLPRPPDSECMLSSVRHCRRMF